MESYLLFGGCHWWAPTFELTLARFVEPNETWSILRSTKHTTVVNKNKTKVFDLLYWSLDDRLENYLFKHPTPKKDKTMGGKEAFLAATLIDE